MSTRGSGGSAGRRPAGKSGSAAGGESRSAGRRSAKKPLSPAARRKRRRGRILRGLLAAFLTLIALGAGTFAIAYAMIDVPEPSDFALAESTTVTYADGETQMGSFAEVSRRLSLVIRLVRQLVRATSERGPLEREWRSPGPPQAACRLDDPGLSLHTDVISRHPQFPRGARKRESAKRVHVGARIRPFRAPICTN